MTRTLQSSDRTPNGDHLTEMVAAELFDARIRGIPIDPICGMFGSADVGSAYLVQAAGIRKALTTGDRVVGRKVGLTSASVQKQLGVDQPDFGTLLDSMSITNGGTINFETLIQPKIEAEVAIFLNQDLDTVDLTLQHITHSIDRAVPALEIVDSRIKDWKISITDTIADNASSGLFVLGESSLPTDLVGLADIEMTVSGNGQTVSQGRGADCMGNPLNSLLWLAQKMQEFGTPLRQGDVVLTGALGPMVAVQAGDAFSARIGPSASVSITFSKGIKA